MPPNGIPAPPDPPPIKLLLDLSNLTAQRDNVIQADMSVPANVTAALHAVAALQDSLVAILSEHREWVNDVIRFMYWADSGASILDALGATPFEVVDAGHTPAVNVGLAVFWDAMRRA